jgi:hypothetical protein
MATSSQYNFNPPLGSLTLAAFSRIGIRRTELLSEHMENAYFELNLMQADWGADGILWWTVELVSVPLSVGVATYQTDPKVVSLLDIYINNGSYNRLIWPFSRTDYASLANPTQQGFPTVYWWDRLIQPTITLWEVPDASATYTMNYYAYTQMQDAVPKQGGNANIPYFWLDAYVADLAHRLARHHAPALEQQRKADRDIAYGNACKQVENTAIFISPGLSGYFRNQ